MVVRRLKQLQKLIKVLANSGYRTSFRRAGVAAATEHESLLKTLRFSTVVDIGANRGQFSLVARRCFPAARIIAFEPLPAAAERFRNALRGDALVTLHQIAIGPSKAEATMHVAAYDDSSSLLPITELQQSLCTGTREVATATVQVDTLSNCIESNELQSPALLKIDVQGFELAVLHGSASLLSRFSHAYIECSFVELYMGQALAAEVIDHLGGHGFDLRGVYNVEYDSQGCALQADFLFAARNRKQNAQS